jgi:hypothetical protein
MYKYKESLKKVNSYRLSDNGVYYVNENNEIIYYTNGSENLIKRLCNRVHILLYKNKLYVSDLSKRTHNYCIDTITKSVVYNFSENGIASLDLPDFLNSNMIGLNHVNKDFSVYDIEADKIFFTVKESISLVYFLGHHYSFLRRRKVNELIGYTENKKKWELDLTGYGNLIKIFGIVDNVLWLWCEDYYFIGVDVSSGSIKKVWEVFDGVYERGRFYFYYPYFDKEEGKVYFFERNSYIECDLRNYATEILWRDKELNENISGPHFTNDYIYFTSSRLNSVFNDRLGVFDRKKMQIIWKEKFDLSQGAGFKIPNVVGDFLYVHDTGNTLHIYEKSDTSLS